MTKAVAKTLLAPYAAHTIPCHNTHTVAAPKVPAHKSFGLSGTILAWEGLTGEDIDIEHSSDLLALSILRTL